MTDVQKRILRLYRLMPGAPRIPGGRGAELKWGEVMANDHWAFCAAIEAMITEGIEDMATAAGFSPAERNRLKR
jgi:hypothetical protein